ncbi:hypothetical protein RI065_10030 [Mycoplasmatota bacterium zrk1]
MFYLLSVDAQALTYLQEIENMYTAIKIYFIAMTSLSGVVVFFHMYLVYIARQQKKGFREDVKLIANDLKLRVRNLDDDEILQKLVKRTESFREIKGSIALNDDHKLSGNEYVFPVFKRSDISIKESYFNKIMITPYTGELIVESKKIKNGNLHLTLSDYSIEQHKGIHWIIYFMSNEDMESNSTNC